jgi:hypothetical protein
LADDQWICFNDTGVTVVSEEAMRNDADGANEGSSAYLLVYKKLGDIEEFIEPVLRIEEIEKDNLMLAAECVYFSVPFAEFMIELSRRGDATVALTYYVETLAHSSLINEFTEMSNALSERLPEVIQFFEEHLDYIVDVTAKCTVKEIRIAFCDLMRKCFESLPPDSVLIALIMSEVHEWKRVVLENWRNGFDLFRIFYDFAALSNEHRQFICEAGIIDILLDFLEKDVPAFVNNKENKITRERFCRLCDMTQLIRCFGVMLPDVTRLTATSLLKWLIGSDYHQDALVDVLRGCSQNVLMNVDRYVEDCGTTPSEFLVARLVTFPSFRCPMKWMTRYFGDEPQQRHLLNALIAEFDRDSGVFELVLGRQDAVVCHLLFSTHSEIREYCVREIQKRASEKVTEILFKFLEKIPALSKAVTRTGRRVLREKYFGLPFLEYLSEFAVTCPNLEEYSRKVEVALSGTTIYTMDEHALYLAQIGCSIMKKVEVGTGLLLAIQAGIAANSDIPSRIDPLLRQYMMGLSKMDRLPMEYLIPDNDFGTLLVKVLLDYDGGLSKRYIFEFFQEYGKKR